MKKRTLINKIRYWFSPSFRKRHDAEQREIIKWLVEHPEAPCMIEGSIIPNGFGNAQDNQLF